MADIAKLIVMIKTVGARQAASEIDKVATSSQRTERSTDKLARSTDNLSDTYKKLRNSAAAFATYNAIKAITHTGLEFDRMTRSLMAATGSTKSAKEEMSFLRAEADRIGLSILSVGKSYAQLSAAAKGTEISQGQVRDIFTAVSEAAIVLGLSADDTKGSMRALVQVMSKGKVQAEELRGQIGERFPGAFQAASRAMSMTTEELSDMLERGDLLASEFIPKFSAELRRTYAGAVPEAVGSAQAAFGRFQTAVANAQNEIAQGGLLDSLATMAEYSAEWSSSAIKEVKATAEWAAALSVGQIGFWEWMTTGSDEAQIRLKEINEEIQAILTTDMSGKIIKIVRPPDEAPKRTRSEIAAEKRATARAKKQFDAVRESMRSEEQAIQDSYVSRNRIIYDNTQASSEYQKKLIMRSKELYAEDLSAYEASKTEEVNSLISSLMTEEEAIKASYDRRMKIATEGTFDNEEERAQTIARIKEDMDAQIAVINEAKQLEYNTIRDSLRSEEEAILDSYNERRALILASTVATAEEKAELIKRLNEEFAEDALGEFAKPNTFDEEIAGIEELYARRHELIMMNTAFTVEARNALEIELERQKNEVIAGMERARMQNMLKSTSETFGGLAELAKTFKGEQSKEYKAMFAASQAFEIAQAIMKTYDAATGAYSAMSSIPYVGPALGIAAAAAAVGTGMANVAQIRGQTYSGAYDAGGSIPSGSVGLVGEIGPELVTGPASIISRKETAALMAKEKESAPEPPPAPVNNIRIVNAFEASIVGDYMGSTAGEEVILNVVRRNAQTIKQMTG